MREAVTVCQRLAIALRCIATGNAFEDLLTISTEISFISCELMYWRGVFC